MPFTQAELDAIKAAAVAGLSSPAQMVRDGDQQVEMRTPAQIAEALAICNEVEDMANGKQAGLVVLCPEPVTL